MYAPRRWLGDDAQGLQGSL
ncbi:hypothetical protein [Sphingomonas sp.]